MYIYVYTYITNFFLSCYGKPKSYSHSHKEQKLLTCFLKRIVQCKYTSKGLDLITLEMSFCFMFPKAGIITETSPAGSLGKAPKIVRLII